MEGKKRRDVEKGVHPKCNKRYMKKGQIEDQLQTITTEKRKAAQREELCTGKFQKQALEFEREDHYDLTTIFD